MAEPADINVDELRRRARRRLIGAIVLALGAAVIVPMLLESEPKPLGEDVAVKIPPVDDGKFVNRLSGAADGADNSKGARRETRAPAISAAEEIRRRCRKSGRRPRGEGAEVRHDGRPRTGNRERCSGGCERRARRTGRSRTIAEERRGADGDRIQAACIGEGRGGQGRLCGSAGGVLR
jgi:hypothetical protein